MNLIKEQMKRLDRLDDLQAHISDTDNKRMSIARPDKVTITADQVKLVKQLLRTTLPMVSIQKLTELSEYHVRGVRRGKYDFLLE